MKTFVLSILLIISSFAFGQTTVMIVGHDGERFETELISCTKSEVTITEGGIPSKEISEVAFTSYSENSSERYSILRSAGIRVTFEYKKCTYKRLRSSPRYIIEDMPVDDDGIVFSAVVRLDSIPTSDIFYRGKEFFVAHFKSAKDVIQLEDRENAVLVGRGWQDISVNTPIGVSAPVQMWYKIRIQAREGRYKYQVFDIEFTTYQTQYLPSTTTPAETVFDRRFYFNKKGNPRTMSENYKVATLNAIASITSSIERLMARGSGKKDDW